jgi:hypothetical protein
LARKGDNTALRLRSGFALGAGCSSEPVHGPHRLEPASGNAAATSAAIKTICRTVRSGNAVASALPILRCSRAARAIAGNIAINSTARHTTAAGAVAGNSTPNVVAVGGTYFFRDKFGNFAYEEYYNSGGDISPYEPRPSYQSGVAGIVGNHRGYPDVVSDSCCAAIYVNGGWMDVGGTSWSSPTFAGIVNAAGSRQQSSLAELTMMYNELANPTEYQADFNDITEGSLRWCKVGWDLCSGIGSAKTYAGK